MTLADLTALLSRIGKRNPELMATRDARLLVDAIIDEGRKLPSEAPYRATADVIDGQVESACSLFVHGIRLGTLPDARTPKCSIPSPEKNAL